MSSALFLLGVFGLFAVFPVEGGAGCRYPENCERVYCPTFGSKVEEVLLDLTAMEDRFCFLYWYLHVVDEGAEVLDLVQMAAGRLRNVSDVIRHHLGEFWVSFS